MNIPKITYETLTAITISIEHDDWYFDRCVQQLKKENEFIHELIQVVRSISTSDKDKVAAEAYARGICTVYKLVENQLESNEMNVVCGSGNQ